MREEMTREEAIEKLKRWRLDVDDEKEYAEYLEGWFYKDDEIAFDMAIEALKEQKTGKWIVDDEYIDCSYCRREKWSRVPFEQLVSGFRFCPNCGSYNGGDEE